MGDPAIRFILFFTVVSFACPNATAKAFPKKLPHLPSRAISKTTRSIQHPQHIPANLLQFVRV
jgi:hypothetical protein